VGDLALLQSPVRWEFVSQFAEVCETLSRGDGRKGGQCFC